MLRARSRALLGLAAAFPTALVRCSPLRASWSAVPAIELMAMSVGSIMLVKVMTLLIA